MLRSRRALGCPGPGAPQGAPGVSTGGGPPGGGGPCLSGRRPEMDDLERPVPSVPKALDRVPRQFWPHATTREFLNTPQGNSWVGRFSAILEVKTQNPSRPLFKIYYALRQEKFGPARLQQSVKICFYSTLPRGPASWPNLGGGGGPTPGQFWVHRLGEGPHEKENNSLGASH